jgi:hypothetical protein
MAYSEEDFRLVFGGVTKEQEELKAIQESLEKFIETHGGQYICTVIWPEKKAPKGQVSMGSAHVKTMTSAPYDRAVNGLVTGEAMFSKK